MATLVDVLPIRPESPPLRVDAGGVVRVGRSRVSLDLVVEEYRNGATAEDIARAYDTLDLADVHSVIAWCLRHPDEVRSYLARRRAEAGSLKAAIETERPRVSPDELRARLGAGETADAAAGK